MCLTPAIEAHGSHLYECHLPGVLPPQLGERGLNIFLTPGIKVDPGGMMVSPLSLGLQECSVPTDYAVAEHLLEENLQELPQLEALAKRGLELDMKAGTADQPLVRPDAADKVCLAGEGEAGLQGHEVTISRGHLVHENNCLLVFSLQLLQNLGNVAHMVIFLVFQTVVNHKPPHSSEL